MNTMLGALLRLLEQLADPRGPEPHEHLDELARVQREERHVRLARHRPREERLAGAGRPDEQEAARDPPAQRAVPSRAPEEVDDLDELVLGLIDAGDVGEAHRILPGSIVIFALLRRNPSGPPAPCPARRSIMKNAALMRKSGTSQIATCIHTDVWAVLRLDVDLLVEQRPHDRLVLDAGQPRHADLLLRSLRAGAADQLDLVGLHDRRGDLPAPHLGDRLVVRHERAPS